MGRGQRQEQLGLLRESESERTVPRGWTDKARGPRDPEDQPTSLDSEDNALLDAHVLTPRICEYTTLCGKGDFTDVTQLRNFETGRWS